MVDWNDGCLSISPQQTIELANVLHRLVESTAERRH